MNQTTTVEPEVSADPSQDDWPHALDPYRLDDADVLGADTRRRERPSRDTLGNPGHETSLRHRGRLSLRRPVARVLADYEELGFHVVRRHGPEIDLRRDRRPVTDVVDVDPFLLDDSVTVRIEGREFPGQQRALIEAKCESLREELANPGLDDSRRLVVQKMLDDFDRGLRTVVHLQQLTRRFRPTVSIREPRESIGELVPVRAGVRLVYRVNTIDHDAGEEGAAEPMVFHVVGLGESEAVLLYTGGVHGLRHLRDLDESPVHHAWFANRERVKTDSTAPWLGRRTFADLMEYGSSEIVIHSRRDAEPIGIEKIGEDESYVRVDGRPLPVPVIRCRTTRDDDLVVLRDPESPLVLRLEEHGAELLRTIDDILSAPGHEFVFPSESAFE